MRSYGRGEPSQGEIDEAGKRRSRRLSEAGGKASIQGGVYGEGPAGKAEKIRSHSTRRAMLCVIWPAESRPRFCRDAGSIVAEVVVSMATVVRVAKKEDEGGRSGGSE
ncbi:hypothetical protein MRX96_056420 [Rhipicephalus microplus]